MERTSSLDLFRGSDAFSTLAFLEGQEPTSETSNGHTAVQSLQASQAIPASLPVNSLHLTAPGQRPSSKLLHTSRLAPGFLTWPQTTSHSFLSFGNPASHQPGGTADSQTDSFAALLADDTALDFADDCFRRESDLYLSQDRAAQAEAVYASGPPSSADGVSPANGQSHAPDSASNQPAAISVAQQTASTASPIQESVGTLTDLQTLSTLQTAGASQTPATASLDRSLPAATEGTNQHDSTAAKPCPSCTEPQILHDQQSPGTLNTRETADVQAVAPAVSQTEQLSASMMPGQPSQAPLSSSPAAALSPEHHAGKQTSPSKVNSPKSTQSGLASATQPMPAFPLGQAASSEDVAPEVRALDHRTGGLLNYASMPTTAAHPHLQAAAHATQDSDQVALAQQQQQPPRQQQSGSEASAKSRFKLAVQDYQLPMPQVIREAPVDEPEAHEGRHQPPPSALKLQVKQDVHAHATRSVAASGEQISAQNGGSPGALLHSGWHACSNENACCQSAAWLA